MPTDNEHIYLAMCGPAGEHEHEWEPTFRTSRIAGTPHRQCTVEGCNIITLDSDECDCGDFDGCSDCHAWAENMLADGWNPWSLKPIEPDETVKPLPPRWY